MSGSSGRSVFAVTAAQQTGVYPLKVGLGTARGAPAVAPTCATGGAGALTGSYLYKYTDTDLVGETTPGPASIAYVAAAEKITVTIPLPRPGTVTRRLYRTSAGGADYKLIVEFGGSTDSHQTIYVDNIADGARSAVIPAVDTSLSFGFLAQPDGMIYASHSPAAAAAGDFTLLNADGRDGSSWTMDAYGPVISRTALGTNFVAFHTGTSGAVFAGYYLGQTKDGVAEVLSFQVQPGGGIYAYQRAGSSAGLNLEGFANSLRICHAVADANPVFSLDYNGLALFGAGGATSPDTNLYRSGVARLGTDMQMFAKTGLDVGSGANGSATLDVANTSATASLKVRNTAGITMTMVATASLGQIGTGNNGELQVLQNGAARMRYGTGGEIGVFGSAGTTKQAVAGSRGGNAALASLLTILAGHGWVTDSSTA